MNAARILLGQMPHSVRVDARVRRVSWGAIRAAVFLLVLPVTITQVLLLQQPGGHSTLLAALLVVTSLAWVAWSWERPWRTPTANVGTWPLALMLTIALVSGMATMVDGPGWSANFAGPALVAAGASLDRKAVFSVPLLGGIGVLAGGLIYGGSAFGMFGQLPTAVYIVFYAALFVVVTLAGVALGLRRQQLEQAHLLLLQQEQATAGRERAAALAERTRIAREIHDVLAHSLADLSIQLEVADALLSDSSDQSGALARVRHAHRLAGEGLEETRRAIRALRSDAPPLPEALAAMVGAYRLGGWDASFDLDGAPRPLTVTAGLALIRTAQEALANARKHAPGTHVELSLCYEPERVLLTVSDGDGAAAGRESVPEPLGPRTAGGGYGLCGMRERLRLAGGSLMAGPIADGWTVHAEVPE